MNDIPRFAHGGIYHSELGLYEFQEIGVAEAYLRENALAIWDTGIGKTHLGMATSALLFEDDLIDLTIVICESNKLREWIVDFGKFTKLTAALYHGGKRSATLDSSGDQQSHCLVTTYDTFKRDVATFVLPPGKVRKVIEPGPLMEWLAGKRCYFIFDEITRLKNRQSDTWKATNFAVQTQRQWGARTLGLTATPMDTSPEDVYNICLLLDPSHMPTPTKFQKYYAMGVDGYGNLRFKKSRLPEFHALIRPMLMRKRKSDMDVIEQFPKQIEESTAIDMKPDQRQLYETVESWGTHINDDQGIAETEIAAHWGLLRQIAAYPAAVVASVKAAESNGEPGSRLGAYLVREWGADEIEAISSAKAERLVDYLSLLVLGQREKVVVFTYYGPSVGPLLTRDLREAGIRVYPHHPPLSQHQRDVNKDAFRLSKSPCVLLSSDAGSRGMNLPEASYVVHYEMPVMFSTYRQRSDRNHRIDSKLPAVTSMAFILRDTVEEDIAAVCIDRNDDQDVILGDTFGAQDQHVLAQERRVMLRIAREKRQR